MNSSGIRQRRQAEKGDTGMPKFIITVRSIDGTTFGDRLGKIRYLIVPDAAETPTTEQVVALSPWIAAIMATFRPPGAKPGANVTGEALFIAHGFNNSATDVVALHGEIAKGLAETPIPYHPTIISFDWPSEGKVYAYLEDLDTAAHTAVAMVNGAVKPLLKAQTPECKVRVNAIAHSMGAFVLRKALGHADDGIETGTDWMIGQLALVAGDVEASSFANGDTDTKAMMGHTYRLTNYASWYDEALMISNAKRAGVEERVGRIGLPTGAPAHAVNVNCSDRYDALTRDNPLAIVSDAAYSHSWYFKDAVFMRDLAQTLRGAVDRNVVARRSDDADGGFDLAVG
jgi:esterase/lipase superfamily enzyme